MDLAMLESLQEFSQVSYLCRVNEHFLTEIVFIDGMTLMSKSPTEWYHNSISTKRLSVCLSVIKNA
jgi:hypothetical protein